MFAKATRPGIFVFRLRRELPPETNIEMALHREIYWVGKQWAVTGYGMQAVDQKRKGKFDIEASRLWEDDLFESMHAEKWLNIEDFERALAVARKQYPEPPRKAVPPEKAAPPEEGVPGLIATVLKETSPKVKDTPLQKPELTPQKFAMRVDGWPAKFVPLWRIRIRL
jgi:hypothetical protein